VNRGIPVCEIFTVPETGCFGFRYYFEGRPLHTLSTFTTLQGVLDTCDPHKEHVREEASDADENKILISRGDKPGSVLNRLEKRYA